MAAPTLHTRPLAERVTEEIRVEMARQRVNQVELAARMLVAQPWISRRLSGKTPITLEDLERIANALRVDVGLLMSGPRSAWTLAA